MSGKLSALAGTKWIQRIIRLIRSVMLCMYTHTHIYSTHIILYIYFDMRSWLVEFILATLTVLSNQRFQHNCFNLSDWISIHISFFFPFYLPSPLFGIYCFHWKVGNKHQWWWHYEPHNNLPWVLTSGECQPPSGGKCSHIDSLPPYSDGLPKDKKNQRDFPSFIIMTSSFTFFFLSLPSTILFLFFPEHRKFPWLCAWESDGQRP